MTIPPLQPGRDHSVGAAEAADMTRRHRTFLTAEATTASASGGAIGGLRDTLAGTRPPEDGTLGGLFSKKAILALLSRADAEFLRYYHARDTEGKRTIVLVAADAKGNDLLDGGTQTLDHHWPCPPYCPPEASALRG
jgi:hypothetical protein